VLKEKLVHAGGCPTSNCESEGREQKGGGAPDAPLQNRTRRQTAQRKSREQVTDSSKSGARKQTEHGPCSRKAEKTKKSDETAQ